MLDPESFLLGLKILFPMKKDPFLFAGEGAPLTCKLDIFEVLFCYTKVLEKREIMIHKLKPYSSNIFVLQIGMDHSCFHNQCSNYHYSEH